MSARSESPLRPYKGLARFDDSELDERLFFGRDGETELVASNLVASRLTVLYGPSGVGKSSLLRAGVMRRLRALVPAGAGPAEGDGALPVVVDEWRDDPLAAIAAAVGAEAPTTPTGLADSLAERSAEIDGEIYLVLDQMEEYFVYHGREQGGPLRDALAEILTRPTLRVHVLLGIRDDALAELDAFKGRVPALFGNVLRLDHLDVDAARAAIIEPLAELEAMGGPRVEVEPALVAAVVDQVASGRIERRLAGRGMTAGGTRRGRVEAPYLQLVMDRIWEVERERGSSVLHAQTLVALGGAGRIVQEHLERALGKLDEPERQLVARLFHQLVTPSGTKIAHAVGDLSRYAHDSPERLESVLHALATERVVRALPGRNGGGVRYEIYHDVLAGAVLDWRARHEAEQAVLDARREARRRHRRLAFFAGGACMLLAVLALLTAYAFDQRSEAQKQARLATGRQESAEQAAARARAAQRDAQQSGAKALAAEAAAKKSASNARKQADAATAAKIDAQHQQDVADQAREDAEAQTEAADRARADAQQQAARAEKSRDDARRSAQKAETQKRRALLAQVKAEAATDAALNAKRQAEAEASVSEASSQLSTDPERALIVAVAGARTQASPPGARSLAGAGDNDLDTRLERVLRDGLLATRARVVLPGGGGTIPTIAMSGDGSLVVVPASGGEARVFEVSTGKLLTRITHGHGLRTAVFAPDGRSVVTGGDDGVARRWDVRTGARLAAYRHGAPIREIAFSPNGRFVATAAGEAVRIWDAERGNALATRGQSVSVTSVSFNPAGTLLLAVAQHARLYEVGTWRPLQTLDPSGSIRVARFAPVGPLLVTAGPDHPATIWSTTDGSQLHVLSKHGAGILDVAWSPGGDRIATASTDNGARVWETDTGDLYAFLGAHSNQITAVAFSPDGESIATSSLDGSARIWSGSFYARHAPLLGHANAVRDVVFSPDGRSVLTASDDGSARVWKPWVDPQLAFVGRHDAQLRAVDVSPDGSMIVAADASGTTLIWRLRHGRIPRSLPHPSGVAVLAASFSPQGDLVLTAAEDGVARLWQVSDGRLLGSFRHGSALRSAAFDARGVRLVTAGVDGAAQVWAITGRRLRTVHHGSAIAAAVFSPDGRVLATAGDDGTGRVWRVADGELLGTLVGHEAPLTSIAFSPDGTLIATSSRDADARIWDADTFRPIRVLRGHSALVSDVSFSSDGRWIATAGPTTVGLWETNSGRRIDAGTPRIFLRGHGPAVRAVAFGAGGRLASAGDDGTVRTYLCELCGTTAQLVKLAERRIEGIGRSLTPAERKLYVGAP
jgi:WD40 repeat protein